MVKKPKERALDLGHALLVQNPLKTRLYHPHFYVSRFGMKNQ